MNAEMMDKFREEHGQEALRKELKKYAKWTVQKCCSYLGVDVKYLYYQSHILTLPHHPTPINENAGRLEFWADEMSEFLDDKSNLKVLKPKRAAQISAAQ